jgi:hypothetical protein
VNCSSSQPGYSVYEHPVDERDSVPNVVLRWRLASASMNQSVTFVSHSLDYLHVTFCVRHFVTSRVFRSFIISEGAFNMELSTSLTRCF